MSKPRIGFLFLMLCFALGSSNSQTMKYDPLISKAVCQHETVKNIETAAWHKGRLYQESGLQEHVVSPVGAKGIAQFIDATAQAMNVDPWNPGSAIDGMVRYTRWIDAYYSKNSTQYAHAEPTQKQMFIDAGYNWRMDRLTRMARVQGWNFEVLKYQMPLETRQYSPAIQSHKKSFLKNEKIIFTTCTYDSSAEYIRWRFTDCLMV